MYTVVFYNYYLLSRSSIQSIENKTSDKVIFVLTQEWRHAHGMRCLGIPNTAHFANVTLIEDAVACTIELHYYYNSIMQL